MKKIPFDKIPHGRGILHLKRNSRGIVYRLALSAIFLGILFLPAISLGETRSLNYCLKKYGAQLLNPDFEEVETFDEAVFHAGDEKRKIKVRVLSGMTKEDSEKYIDEQSALLEGLFEPHLPPYPEFLTNETECGKDFKPVRKEAKFGVYFLLYAGERFGYGVCAKDLINYKATLAFFYCAGSKTLFKIEYFVPKDQDFEKVDHFAESFRCIQ